MTEEQKEILIAKMLDAPSSLSDGELDSILHDEELRDIYEMSAAISSACIPQPELDMRAEWTNFRPRIRRKPTAMRWVMRVAAIFLIVLFASSIAVKIFDNIFADNQQPVITKAEQIPETKICPIVHQDTQVAEANNIEAEKGLPIIRRHTSVSNHHLAQAKPRQPKTCATQIETDIDVDEYLRIQQARIDNDLAMQAAESYIAEYDGLAAVIDATDTYNPALDNMIKEITME